MTHHHDDHLAVAIHDSYRRPRTTAEVADQVTEIITEFETFRRQIRHIATLAGFGLGMALAAGIGIAWVVLR